MTVTEHEIERALDRSAERLDRSKLLDPNAIERAAAVRRRRRSLVGMAASLLLVVGCLGVFAATMSDDEPTSVFAGEGALDASQIVISSAVWHDGRYVALATEVDAEHDDLENLENLTHFVIESADGSTWTPTEAAPTFTARYATMTERDGTFVVVASESVPASDDVAAAVTSRLVIASSVDLTNWEQSNYSLPPGTLEAGQVLTLRAAVASDAGVLVAGAAWDDFPSVIDELEDRGYDPDELCELTGTTTRVTFRVCGTNDKIVERIEIEEQLTPPEEVLLFVPTGEDLSAVDLPDDGEPRRTPSASIHSTQHGFGVSYSKVYESNDGKEWVEVDTRNDTGVMMAVRGDERVYRTWFPVGRFSDDDPLYGMAYRGPDDAEWQPIDLADLYDDPADTPRFFNSLRAGPAGWIVVGQRSPSAPDDVGVERDGSGESDFVVTAANGYELRGHYPVGPATLMDDDGEIVRAWEVFEAADPEWSGWRVDSAGVSLDDPDTGEAVVTFDAVQWSALQHPREALEYDLFFSSNGLDWQVLTTGSQMIGMPRVVAMAEDEILVQFGQVVGATYVNEVRVVPIPVG